jgi:hypothetical protein
MARLVTHDQFQLDGDALTHVPTGARFRLGEEDVISSGMGGGQPGAPGAFDPEELRKAALEILECERTDCL